MAFIRTKSGISNQHLFYQADFIVFVEGGNHTYTIPEIEKNNYNEFSNDMLFWERIFAKFKKNKKIKFKAVGSKYTVCKIAEKIIKDNILTVYAAMDKDFDDILGNLKQHKNVIYTNGYSWENDVWNADLIKSIMKDLTAVTINEIDIDTLYNKFLKEIKIGVYADGYQFSKGSSFFPRPSGHMRIINCNSSFEPHLLKSEIEELIKNQGLKKSNLYAYGNRKSIKSKSHCYGHLFEDFCRHIILFLCKTKYKIGAISKEIIRRMAINKFMDHIDTAIIQYYKTKLA